MFSQESPEDVTREVTESADNVFETVGDWLPRLGISLGVIAVGYLISRLFRFGTRKAFERRRTQSFARVMSKLIGWFVLALFVAGGMTIAFPSVKPVDVLAGLGFFSVAIGFAFQDILENTLSGVLLLFRQPFISGDQISVNEQSGTVTAITIRETRIRSYDGQLIVIPNRDVYKSAITVQTHFHQRRLSFAVGIAYENDADEARHVISDAVSQIEGVDSEPAVEALVSELGVSTVDIEVYFWTDPVQFPSLVVLDGAIRAAKSALDAEGIEMPADILALQATPSFRAALTGEQAITPGGSVRPQSEASQSTGRT